VVEIWLLHSQSITNNNFHFRNMVKPPSSLVLFLRPKISSSTRATFTSILDVQGRTVHSVAIYIRQQFFFLGGGKCFVHQILSRYALHRGNQFPIALPLHSNLSHPRILTPAPSVACRTYRKCSLLHPRAGHEGREGPRLGWEVNATPWSLNPRERDPLSII
jgi:hypothetical protein